MISTNESIKQKGALNSHQKMNAVPSTLSHNATLTKLPPLYKKSLVALESQLPLSKSRNQNFLKNETSLSGSHNISQQNLQQNLYHQTMPAGNIQQNENLISSFNDQSNYNNGSFTNQIKKNTMLEQFKNYQVNNKNYEDSQKNEKDISQQKNSLSQMLNYNITPSNHNKKKLRISQVLLQNHQQNEQFINSNSGAIMQGGTVPASIQSHLQQRQLQIESQQDRQIIMNNPSIQVINNYEKRSYAFTSPTGIKIDARDVVDFDYDIFYNELKSQGNNNNRSLQIGQNNVSHEILHQHNANNFPAQNSYSHNNSFGLLQNKKIHQNQFNNRSYSHEGPRNFLNSNLLQNHQSVDSFNLGAGTEQDNSIKNINNSQNNSGFISSNIREGLNNLLGKSLFSKHQENSISNQNTKLNQKSRNMFHRNFLINTSSNTVKQLPKGVQQDSKIDKIIFENKMKHREFIISQLRQKQRVNNIIQNGSNFSENQSLGSLNQFPNNSRNNEQQDQTLHQTQTPRGSLSGFQRNIPSLNFNSLQNSNIQSQSIADLKAKRQIPDIINQIKIGQDLNQHQSATSFTSLDSKKQKILSILQQTLKPLQDKTIQSEVFNKTLQKASELISMKVLGNSSSMSKSIVQMKPSQNYTQSNSKLLLQRQPTISSKDSLESIIEQTSEQQDTIPPQSTRQKSTKRSIEDTKLSSKLVKVLQLSYKLKQKSNEISRRNPQTPNKASVNTSQIKSILKRDGDPISLERNSSNQLLNNSKLQNGKNAIVQFDNGNQDQNQRKERLKRQLLEQIQSQHQNLTIKESLKAIVKNSNGSQLNINQSESDNHSTPIKVQKQEQMQLLNKMLNKTNNQNNSRYDNAKSLIVEQNGLNQKFKNSLAAPQMRQILNSSEKKQSVNSTNNQNTFSRLSYITSQFNNEEMVNPDKLQEQSKNNNNQQKTLAEVLKEVILLEAQEEMRLQQYEQQKIQQQSQLSPPKPQYMSSLAKALSEAKLRKMEALQQQEYRQQISNDDELIQKTNKQHSQYAAQRKNSDETNLISQPTDLSSKRNQDNLQIPISLDTYLLGKHSQQNSPQEQHKQFFQSNNQKGHRKTSHNELINAVNSIDQRSQLLTKSQDNLLTLKMNNKQIVNSSSNPNINQKQNQGKSVQLQLPNNEENKTKSYRDFFEEEELVKDKTAKDLVRQRRNLKYMILLQQRKEKWDQSQKHPILGGYDSNFADKESKKTYKIKMNIQKLDLNLDNFKQNKHSLGNQGNQMHQMNNIVKRSQNKPFIKEEEEEYEHSSY
eukprot:403344584